MAKEKSLLFFFTLTHSLLISFKGGNTLLSHFYFILHTYLSWLSTFSLSGSFLATLSSFSFLCGFLFLCSCTYSLCLLEGSSTLLSLSSCVPPKRISLFSLLVLRSIFPFPIGRTLGPKPSNSLQHCLFIRLFCYSLLN